MDFILLIAVVGGILAACVIVMAVGLLQNKTFKSCGCSSVTFNGETIRCPACPNKEPEEPGVSCCGEKPGRPVREVVDA